MNGLQKIFVISLLVKLAVGALVPLFPDEAYYWVWSHHLQWCYFDHPPMVAGWLWLGHFFEGYFSLVRWPSILLAHITGLLWFISFKKYLSERALVSWALLFALSPLTGPGSIIVTPDLPLMFFWALAFYCLQRLITTDKILWAALLGFAFGLGFCSKYVMVLFFPFSLVWVWFERIGAAKILAWISVASFTFALSSFPVWWWNSQHHWSSIVFQLHHGLADPEPWQMSWTLSYIFGECLLIFPTVLLAVTRQPWVRATRALWVFSLGPLLFFMLTSLKGRAELNWPIIAFPVILALAVANNKKIPWQKSTLSLWAVALVVILSDFAFHWLPDQNNQLKTREYNQIAVVDEAVKNLSPLYARSYQLAATLSFQLHRQIYKLKGMSRADFYDDRPESSPSPVQPFFLIAEPNEQLPLEWQQQFAVIERSPLPSHYELLEVVPR